MTFRCSERVQNHKTVFFKEKNTERYVKLILTKLFAKFSDEEKL